MARIDTVGISFPVHSDFERRGTTASIVNYGTVDEHYRYRRQLAGGGFAGFGVGGKCWAEASLPKRAGANNVEGLALGDAREVLREMVREVEDFCAIDRVRCGDVMADAKVIRLDLVRDFNDVDHLSDLLDGLARVPRCGRMKVRRYADAERNRAETLRVGPKAWGGTLYDKWAETDGLAPLGRARFEWRAHSDQLTSKFAREHGGHVRSLADWSEQKLRSLTAAAFQRCGYDREVATLTTIQQTILNREDLRLDVRGSLLCYVTVPGFAARMSRSKEGRYRRLAAELGLTPAAGELEDGASDVPALVRLDYERGTEVLRAA